jgi:hypothetical protein
VALCLVFLIWFPSGIGIMYWDFPSVTAEDRLERSPSLDPGRILLSPGEALAMASLPSPAQVRLNTFDGRPVYRFRIGPSTRTETDARSAQGRETIVYADTGQDVEAASEETVARIAGAWTGQPPSAATVRAIEEIDQWTVQAPVRNLRPLWKYSWPNGEDVYVSQRSGEVVQYTTRASRIGAYLGPIPHWLYFTPLRTRQLAWSRIVIWSSGIGTASALLGVIIGVWMYSPSRRYRYGGVPTSIPYRGQKRWHMVFGLLFGLGAATWAFSGMLSMDPFPMRGGRPAGRTVNIPQALRGRFDFEAFAGRHPRDVLAALAPLEVRELELTTFAGEPIYLATIAGGGTRVVPMQGKPAEAIDADRIVEAVRDAAGDGGIAETRVLNQYDRYYLDRRRERPLPVILVRLNDEARTRYYIDPKTAQVAGNYSARSWVSRWLYHGLHSLDFPWLYNYRPAWDIVVIFFMVGGTALSVTSLVLAWRVLGRKLAAIQPGYLPRQRLVVSDDLTEEE